MNEDRQVDIVVSAVVAICVLIFLIAFPLAYYEYYNFGEVCGTIVDKDYHKAYTDVRVIYTYKQIMIPQTMFHEEKWRFVIEKEINSEKKKRIVEVDEETYNKYNIGDYFKEGEVE